MKERMANQVQLTSSEENLARHLDENVGTLSESPGENEQSNEYNNPTAPESDYQMATNSHDGITIENFYSQRFDYTSVR
jgi:hypothetical protein